MVADARAAATVIEAVYSDQKSYAGANGTVLAGPSAVIIGIAGINYSIAASRGNTLAIQSTPTAFTITVSNPASTIRGSLVLTGHARTCQWATGEAC